MGLEEPEGSYPKECEGCGDMIRTAPFTRDGEECYHVFCHPDTPEDLDEE